MQGLFNLALDVNWKKFPYGHSLTCGLQETETCFTGTWGELKKLYLEGDDECEDQELGTRRLG